MNGLINFVFCYWNISFNLKQGDTLETGHYTAACKNPYDHQWYKFDDQRVNVVPNDRVQEEIVNNEAYILFYQRRKDDSAECSGSNSSSSGEHWVSKMCTSSVTINSDVKKDDVEKMPVVPVEKSELDPIVAVHSNKNIQTDDSCTIDRQMESVVAEMVPTSDADSASKSVMIQSTTDVPIKVEPTNEDEIVDVIGLDAEKSNEVELSIDSAISSPSITKEEENVKIVQDTNDETNISMETSKINADKEDSNSGKLVAIHPLETDIDIEVELRNLTVKKSDGALSVSFPTQRSLWPFENHHNTIHTYTPILSRGSLNFNELLANERNTHLRHSLSTTLGHQRNSNSADKSKVIGVTANDTLAMVRGAGSCSKDTLIFVDQQTHRHRSIMDMANQPLWVRSFYLHMYSLYIVFKDCIEST